MSATLVNRKKIQLPNESIKKNFCSCDKCNTSINLSFGDIRIKVHRLDDNNKIYTELICSDCYNEEMNDLVKSELFNNINK